GCFQTQKRSALDRGDPARPPRRKRRLQRQKSTDSRGGVSCCRCGAVGRGQTHFEFSPIVFRTYEPYVAAMQARELARQIQANPMPGSRRGRGAVVKTLENVFAAGDGAPGVSNAKHNFAASGARAQPDATAGAVVFAGVLQEILDNERGVSL